MAYSIEEGCNSMALCSYCLREGCNRLELNTMGSGSPWMALGNCSTVCNNLVLCNYCPPEECYTLELNTYLVCSIAVLCN